MDIHLGSILPNVFQNNYCLYPMSDSSKIQLDSKIIFQSITAWRQNFILAEVWHACFWLRKKIFGGVAKKSDSDN